MKFAIETEETIKAGRQTVAGHVKSATSMAMKIWPVSGGKGGVGKSVVSANLSITLAKKLTKKGKQVILVDCDLSNSSLSSFLGVPNPPLTLKDFLFTKQSSLKDISLNTAVESLKLICGSSDVVGIANLKYLQKLRILDQIRKLDAEYVILDLGTGSSYNVMDFFLMSNRGIVVTTPDRISLSCTFSFLKSCLLRRCIRKFAGRQDGKDALDLIIETIRTLRLKENHSMQDLVDEVDRVNAVAAGVIRNALQMFKPRLILNMVRSNNEIKVGDEFKAFVSQRLSIEMDCIGYIEYDDDVRVATRNLAPAVLEYPDGPFSEQLDFIVWNLLGYNRQSNLKFFKQFDW